ncbi:MFS transporter [Candidatus Kaiserbacteria bacterium]|nr:MFS transporter [Candidatus Kaiserbacteria bacterium]
MHPRVILSVGNFFFSIFSALVTFSLLPYLSSIMPAAYAGFVVAGSALCATIIFPFLPQLVGRYGAQYITLILAFSEMLVLLALAINPGVVTAVLLMAITIAVQPFLSYQFDVLLEATIADTNTTGRVRTLFRTAWSVADLAAPLLLGALLADSDSYGRVFIAAAAVLIPIVVLFSGRRLPRGPAPKLFSIHGTLVHIIRHRDLAAVTFANFLLYLFIVWMPLYTPVYLHTVLGISWSNLGWMFALMLIPYAIIEYPAGWIADRYLGDKELMFAGFLIAGGATVALSFLTPETSLGVIVVILVVSRVGAALMESMIEAHFFRRINKRDIDSVSIFRGVWPLSYIIGPIIGSVILIYADYQLFFLLTGGFIALAGGITTLFIKDFR